MISRRTALRLGGGTLALGAAGTLVRAIDQGLVLPRDRPGLAAWNDWNSRRYTGELSLVAAGLLAASPHNTQPWRFAIGRHGVDLFEVPERQLGAMDPFGRERLAGLGAAIHNMALASTVTGRAALVRLLPDPANPVHVARIELADPGSAAVAAHPLLPAIGRRHTDRGPWTRAGIAAADLQALAATAGHPSIRILLFDRASALGARFAALTIEANAAIADDAAMMAASQAWTLHSRRDQDRRMDGLGIATSGLSLLVATAAAILPQLSAATEGQYWLAATRDTALPTASTFGLIVAVDPHDRRTALLGGMAWQRLHLTAVARGLAAQPQNQLPEMIDRERQLGRPPRFARAADALLGDPAWRPTFAFRLGHAIDPAPGSPRRPVSLVIGAPARLQYDIDTAAAGTAASDAAMRKRLR